VFLLLGGPGAAIVTADPGGSRNGSGNSSQDGRGNGSQKDGERGGSDSKRSDAGNGRSNGTAKTNSASNDNGGNRRADTAADDSDVANPRARVGSGRDDKDWIAPGGGAVTSNQRVAGSETGVQTGAETADEAATGGTELGATLGGSQSPSAAGPGARQSPRVTFGNGRTPGVSGDTPEPNWRSPVQQAGPAQAPPPPPPPPATGPPPSLVDRIAAPPAPTTQLGVAPTADWSDPLWGIAGLLLIPAAGAALGYRQARATQAVERLRQS
jgi:hypothetical protein